MSAEVLVSAFLAKIAEFEQRGPAADEVLRLCRAHRDLIGEYQKRQQMADQLGADEESKNSDAHIMAVGIAAGLQAAVALVARGLGVEEQADG